MMGTHIYYFIEKIFLKNTSDEYKKLYGKNLEPPQTWEEYDQIAKFLTLDTDDDGVHRFIWNSYFWW